MSSLCHHCSAGLYDRISHFATAPLIFGNDSKWLTQKWRLSTPTSMTSHLWYPKIWGLKKSSHRNHRRSEDLKENHLGQRAKRRPKRHAMSEIVIATQRAKKWGLTYKLLDVVGGIVTHLTSFLYLWADRPWTILFTGSTKIKFETFRLRTWLGHVNKPLKWPTDIDSGFPGRFSHVFSHVFRTFGPAAERDLRSFRVHRELLLSQLRSDSEASADFTIDLGEARWGFWTFGTFGILWEHIWEQIWYGKNMEGICPTFLFPQIIWRFCFGKHMGKHIGKLYGKHVWWHFWENIL